MSGRHAVPSRPRRAVVHVVVVMERVPSQVVRGSRRSELHLELGGVGIRRGFSELICAGGVDRGVVRMLDLHEGRLSCSGAVS